MHARGSATRSGEELWYLARARLVEADVAIASDTEHLQVDTSCDDGHGSETDQRSRTRRTSPIEPHTELLDLALVLFAQLVELIGSDLAARNVRGIGRNVDMVKEMVVHKVVVALLGLARNRVVLVEVVGLDVREREALLLRRRGVSRDERLVSEMAHAYLVEPHEVRVQRDRRRTSSEAEHGVGLGAHESRHTRSDGGAGVLLGVEHDDVGTRDSGARYETTLTIQRLKEAHGGCRYSVGKARRREGRVA